MMIEATTKAPKRFCTSSFVFLKYTKKKNIFIIETKKSCQKPFFTSVATSSVFHGRTPVMIVSICTDINTRYVSSVPQITIHAITESIEDFLASFFMRYFPSHDIFIAMMSTNSTIAVTTLKTLSRLSTPQAPEITSENPLSAEVRSQIIKTFIHASIATPITTFLIRALLSSP